MKLVKLSLATALVAGALTTTSFATPLEEAVKDVDLGGYMFVRYTFNQNKDKVFGSDANSSKHKTNGVWRFKSEVNLKTKVDDNFFGVAGLRIDANGQNTRDGGAVAKAPYDVYNLHLGYNVGGTTVLVGRQNIDTFFTDDLFGDGVAVLNSDIEGLTLAALWMDNLYKDGNIVDDVYAIVDENATLANKIRDRVVNNDLFGAAVIGSYDPIAFQLWAARLTSTADLYAGEVSGSFDVADDVNVGFKAQVGTSKINKNFKDEMGVDGTTFFGGELSSAFFGADVAAGYVQYGKKDKLSLVSLEDDGKFLKAGEQASFNYSLFQDKNNALYVTAGYAIPDSDVNVGLDYVHHENKAEDSKTKQDEIVARAGYAYNSKLNFSGYASYLKVKAGEDKTNNTQVRFTAKYSF
ncbi:major outer membrane protein [uncultured Campylobacter sp.]|uniref:major outer membrane protein n=1 Tax=uncultured Campylobacter sp. TaxID=218934 RepID=UPI002605FB99|nr:major outer membrane protein [uncultured Campylobacter sp.]